MVALPPGFAIRPLTTAADTVRAHDVLSEVWGGDASGMPPNLLRALAHSGNYTVGLYDGGRMIGASAAFFAAPAARSMHSHITGILPSYRGRHLGRALKLHERGWALQRGVETITWTFDPLVARNAHFNLRTLGACVTEYLVDFYGDMDDGVNRGDQSDRLLVTWRLAEQQPRDVSAVAAPPGVDRTPADGRVSPVCVALPADIEALRRADSPEAASWRLRVRTAFLDNLAAGLVVTGFDDDRGYLFASAEPRRIDVGSRARHGHDGRIDRRRPTP